MSSRFEQLDERLKARLAVPPSGASQAILWPGKAPAKQYAESATTTSNFDVPPGTLGIVVITSTGFTSLKLTGRTTQFPYVSAGAATAAQYVPASWASSPDDQGTFTIVTGVGQVGSAYAVAFFSPIPPAPNTLIRQNAFPSSSRGVGTYNFDVPRQGAAKGILTYMTVTAGAGTVTLAIQTADLGLIVISGSKVTSTAIAAGQANILTVYPGIPDLVNFTANGVIGQTPRIVAVVAGNAATFAVDYDLVP